MSKYFIAGVTGETGIRLARQLVRRGDRVIGLHRKESQAGSLRTEGVDPVKGDLVTIAPEEMAKLAEGSDAIVFTAGAGGGGDDMTDAIDGEGIVKSAKAAALAGIRRMVLVSAFPDAWRERRMPPSFEHYMFVKRQADVYLASTDLDWVIVRPGTLLNSAGTGRVRTGLAIPYGEISRDDVAGVIAEILVQNKIRRVIIELTQGEDSIRESVGRMAEFSGRGVLFPIETFAE